mgnify:CR=1 FL=1
MCGSQHVSRQRADGLNRASGGPEQLEWWQRLPVAQPDRLLLDRLAGGHGPPPQATFEEVDVRAREPGERGAQIRVQIAAPSLLPGKAEQSQQRLAERRLAEPEPALDGERDPERSEHRLDRRTPSLHRGNDQRDLLERDAAGSELPHLFGDELERAAGAGGLEEADRTVELGRIRLPKFPVPDGRDAFEYLVELCEKGDFAAARKSPTAGAGGAGGGSACGVAPLSGIAAYPGPPSSAGGSGSRSGSGGVHATVGSFSGPPSSPDCSGRRSSGGWVMLLPFPARSP